MACYAPLRAVLVSGPQGKRLDFRHSSIGKSLSLPCSRCIGCRVERARQWAVRIMHEAAMCSEASFLTLTYDPQFLPKDGSISVDTCQLFLKRLRARLSPKKVRFFLCGEYGEKLARPHYHLILFGHDFPDKVFLKESNGQKLFSSDVLSSVWGLGFCTVGSVTFDSACYVANYATKKVLGPSADSHYSGRTPEFLLMSRRPGIGRSWIDKFASDVYPSDEVIVHGRPARPPRYYDKQLFKCLKSTADLLVKRESFASALEDMVLSSGVKVSVSPNRNTRRLAVRRVVAESKFSLKLRLMETNNA